MIQTLGEEPERLKIEKTFTLQELDKLKQIGAEKDGDKWLLPDGREILPQGLARGILNKLHHKTHWGIQALVDQFETNYACVGIYGLAKRILEGCLTCHKVNKRQLREKVQGGRELAKRPFEKIQVDFTELPKAG